MPVERAEVRVYRQADGSYKAFCKVVEAGKLDAVAEGVAATHWEACADAIRRAELSRK